MAERLYKTKDVAWLLDCSPDDVMPLARKLGLALKRAKADGRQYVFTARDVARMRLAMKKAAKRT